MYPPQAPPYQQPIQMGGQLLQQRADQGAAGLGQAQQHQGSAIDMLAGAAQGTTPSQAMIALSNATDANVANQMAMAGQGRGGNLAGAMAAANATGQATQQQAVGQAAQLRAQEMDAARAAYAGQANQMAGQNLGQMQSYDSMGLENQQSQLDRSEAARQFNARLGFDQQQANRSLATQVVGGLGGFMAPLMMSDERLKEDVEDAGEEVRSALDELAPVSWHYKDQKHGQGRKTGVMAQDLEKSKAGRRIVKETPEGKAVDVGGMAALGLAGLADVNRRLRTLEEGKR